MSYSLFEQLSVFAVNEDEKSLFCDMADGIFPSGILYDERNDILSRSISKIKITEISDKQKDIILAFINNDTNENKNYLNKSNISYYMIDYCMKERSSWRKARKLASRLISMYRSGKINNLNIMFRGSITAIIGIETCSLLSKSGKSSYGKSLTPS